MDIRHVGDRECISCGECIDVCPTKAISFKGSKIFLAPSEIDIPEGATDEEIEAIEQKQREKSKKRGRNAKIVIGSLMAIVLAGALVYYNFVSTDTKEKIWGWINELPLVDLYQEKDTNTDTETDTSTDSTTDSSTDTEVDSSTDSSTETESDTETETEAEEFVKPPVGTKVGDSCASSELQIFDQNGLSSVTLDPTKTGKVTVINFWYTTCASCVAELPYFDELASEYKDTVEVVAVHSTDSSFSRAFDFVKNNYPNTEITFLKDTSSGTNDDYYMALGGSKYNAYPMTVIIDEHGVITYTKLGDIEKNVLFNEVEKALNN